MAAYDAIVLAGGRGRRAGGDKLAFRRGGRPLLAYAIDAVLDADRAVVVGPPVTGLPRPVVWRREDPPYAGPVAAVAAALPEVRADVVVLLAGDLPDPADAVVALLAALTPTTDVAVLLDRDGVLQPLLAAYRTAWLRERMAAGGVAARSLLDGARIVPVTDVWDAARDIDTRGDATRQGFAPPAPV